MSTTTKILVDIPEQSDLYSRHKGIDLRVPEEVFIVGCGGVGTWTSIFLSMMGVKTLHLSDFDILENHNRSRLPYSEEWIGKKKTEALKSFIEAIRPDCDIYTYNGINDESDLLQLAGEIVFDCNDNPKTQDMIWNHCKQNKIKYISIGCNADHITVINDMDMLCRGDGYEPYTVTPMFIIPAIVSSACGVWNAVKNEKQVYVLKQISAMFKM